MFLNSDHVIHLVCPRIVYNEYTRNDVQNKTVRRQREFNDLTPFALYQRVYVI